MAPSTGAGRRGRIYYGTQAGVKPPTFVLFCNDPRLFTEDYRKYIERSLRCGRGQRGVGVSVQRVRWGARRQPLHSPQRAAASHSGMQGERWLPWLTAATLLARQAGAHGAEQLSARSQQPLARPLAHPALPAPCARVQAPTSALACYRAQAGDKGLQAPCTRGAGAARNQWCGGRWGARGGGMGGWGGCKRGRARALVSDLVLRSMLGAWGCTLRTGAGGAGHSNAQSKWIQVWGGGRGRRVSPRAVRGRGGRATGTAGVAEARGMPQQPVAPRRATARALRSPRRKPASGGRCSRRPGCP